MCLARSSSSRCLRSWEGPEKDGGEGGSEGEVCTCWRNDDVKRGRDEKERENMVWGWSKGGEGIMEEGMRKRVKKVSKRGRKG